MDTSILLARVIGLTMVVMYGGIFLNLRYYQNVIKSFAQQPLMILLSGFIALILGLLILQVHSEWTLNFRGLITLLAWLMVVQGILRIAAPELVIKTIQKLTSSKSHTFLIVASSIMLIIGIFLTYKGFNFNL